MTRYFMDVILLYIFFNLLFSVKFLLLFNGSCNRDISALELPTAFVCHPWAKYFFCVQLKKEGAVQMFFRYLEITAFLKNLLSI